MLSKFCNCFFLKQDKTVKSRFWLFNLCNSEKKCQNRPTWGRKKCKKNVFGLSVSFSSASAKNFHFGASLVSRKVHKLGLGMPEAQWHYRSVRCPRGCLYRHVVYLFITFSKFDTCLNSLKPLFMYLFIYLFIHSFLPI